MKKMSLKGSDSNIGNTSKGVTELKKRVLEDNIANITRSGKHYKPSFLEKDHPSRDLGEGSKPTELEEKKIKKKKIGS